MNDLGCYICPMKSRKISGYSPEVELVMRQYYNGLDEKAQRKYAALECQKLPFGGVAYIMCLLGIARKRITRGTKELKDLNFVTPDSGRVRLKGGGRKKKATIS